MFLSPENHSTASYLQNWHSCTIFNTHRQICATSFLRQPMSWDLRLGPRSGGKVTQKMSILENFQSCLCTTLNSRIKTFNDFLKSKIFCGPNFDFWFENFWFENLYFFQIFFRFFSDFSDYWFFIENYDFFRFFENSEISIFFFDFSIFRKFQIFVGFFENFSIFFKIYR